MAKLPMTHQLLLISVILLYMIIVLHASFTFIFVCKKLHFKHKESKFYNDWRKKNPHNFTKLKTKVDINRIKVGKNTYGDLNVFAPSNENVVLNIGSYCSIGQNVQFLLADEHPLNTISTYPFKAMLWGLGKEALSKGDIIIEDDVWIGANVIICSGIKIGQGAVIAAGAVVTKDIPPYAIVGGVPAKLIRYRFNESLCKKLISIDITKILDSFENYKSELVYKYLDDNVLSELKNVTL